jgi:hypothetical protein
MFSSLAAHRVVIVALLVALALVASARADAGSLQTGSDDLIGVWDAAATTEGQSAPGLVSFHEGGGVVVTLSTGLSAQGIWESDGASDYLFTWVQLYTDANGAPIGRSVAVASITLDGDELFGEIEVAAFDLAGEMTGSATGTITAVRFEMAP